MTKSNHAPLLPCPFCGSQAHISDITHGSNYIKCWNELCLTDAKAYGDNEEEAIKYWNTRYLPPDIVHRVNNWDKLVEALRYAQPLVKAMKVPVVRELVEEALKLTKGE